MELGHQILAVILVLGLLAALVRLARRSSLVGPGTGSSTRLRSEARLALGPQHTLHLVRAGERALLVVVYPGGCTVVADWPGQEIEPPSPEFPPMPATVHRDA